MITPVLNDDFLCRVIHKAIKDETQNLVNETIEQAKLKLEERLNKTVAGIVLDVMKIMDVQYLENRVIITVRMEKEK